MGPRAPRHLILLSGGLDSAAELYRHLHEAPSTLFVDYGQASMKGELRAANWLSNATGAELQLVHVPNLAELGAGALSDSSRASNPDGRSAQQRNEWFPARNLMLITVAATALGSIGGGVIHIGASSNVYRDTRREFFEAAEKAVDAGMPEEVEIRVELPQNSRGEALSVAVERGLDPRQTFSCNVRGDRHCWRCASCIDREQLLQMVTS
jgi:7-cyano-7-deazaguanine synthase